MLRVKLLTTTLHGSRRRAHRPRVDDIDGEIAANKRRLHTWSLCDTRRW
jgi:hypothetical protein